MKRQHFFFHLHHRYLHREALLSCSSDGRSPVLKGLHRGRRAPVASCPPRRIKSPREAVAPAPQAPGGGRLAWAPLPLRARGFRLTRWLQLALLLSKAHGLLAQAAHPLAGGLFVLWLNVQPEDSSSSLEEWHAKRRVLLERPAAKLKQAHPRTHPRPSNKGALA